MPKTATTKADEPKARRPKSDRQGHPIDGPDAVPTEKEYDPARHANHSHLHP